MTKFPVSAEYIGTPTMQLPIASGTGTHHHHKQGQDRRIQRGVKGKAIALQQRQQRKHRRQKDSATQKLRGSEISKIASKKPETTRDRRAGPARSVSHRPKHENRRKILDQAVLGATNAVQTANPAPTAQRKTPKKPQRPQAPSKDRRHRARSDPRSAMQNKRAEKPTNAPATQNRETFQQR